MPQSPGTVIFDGLPKEPFFETRHSTSSITNIHVPKYLSVEAFIRQTGLSEKLFDVHVAYGQLRLKIIDGTHFVELDSPIAKSLLPTDERSMP